MTTSGRSLPLRRVNSEIDMQMRVTQTVRTRTRPRMDQLGNIWKMSLMKPDSGEWNGAPGMNAADEAVNTNRTKAAMKMLLRIMPLIG